MDELKGGQNHKLLAMIVPFRMLMGAYEAQSRDKEWAAQVGSVYVIITQHTLIFHFKK